MTKPSSGARGFDLGHGYFILVAAGLIQV